MSSLEWIAIIVIVAVWLSFVVWNQKRMKARIAAANKTQEFERNKARLAAVIYPLIGVCLIGWMLFDWRSLPPGNESIGIMIIGFGVIAVLYGFYK
jgi:uncharacterized iron-regulated membrane protein